MTKFQTIIFSTWIDRVVHILNPTYRNPDLLLTHLSTCDTQVTVVGKSNPLKCLTDATKWAWDESQIERMQYRMWDVKHSSVKATSTHNNKLDNSQKVHVDPVVQCSTDGPVMKFSGE